MNQYDQLGLLFAAVGIFKKAVTVASKLIFNDSYYSNANQTGSFASSFCTCTTNFDRYIKSNHTATMEVSFSFEFINKDGT